MIGSGLAQVWVSNGGLFVGGLIILGCGGECLVRGAAHLARQIGVSALVVGLTIVAFGTSAPEIAVSMQAAHQGHDDLAVANVVGSCIMNILIVLAIAALVRPLRVSRNVVTTDAPVMLFFTAFFMLFAIDDDMINCGEGVFFVCALGLYTAFTYHEARRQPKVVEDEYERDLRLAPRPRAVNLLAVVIGIAGLVKGADLMVEGAVGIAQLLGVSKRIVGLTIVALGTSLPELATCVIAARRGQPDIAVGNVIGSNIFNILAVVGVTSVFFELDVAEETLHFDAPVMLFVVVLSFWVLRTGRRISRREGALLLCIYALYLGWLLWQGSPGNHRRNESSEEKNAGAAHSTLPTRPDRRPRPQISRLARVFHGPDFAQNSHFDLPRVGDRFLDPFGDVTGQLKR